MSYKLPEATWLICLAVRHANTIRKAIRRIAAVGNLSTTRDVELVDARLPRNGMH